MEELLDTYALPNNPAQPVVCVDERPCFLIGDILMPIPMKPGKVKKEDYEYTKNGHCSLFVAVEPLTGKRWTKIYSQRTAKEYTDFMSYIEKQFPEAEQINVVQDNLNTHHGGSFYKHLVAEEAHRLTRRFIWTYTPKHASWLNMAEIELSAISRACLSRRIDSKEKLDREVSALVNERNKKEIKILWQFTTTSARDKLQRHYIKVNPDNEPNKV